MCIYQYYTHVSLNYMCDCCFSPTTCKKQLNATAINVLLCGRANSACTSPSIKRVVTTIITTHSYFNTILLSHQYA